jgi:hypothetical protein
MKSKLLVSVIALSATVCLAQSPAFKKMMEFKQSVMESGGSILQTNIGQGDEKTEVYVATKEQIAKSPQWNGKSAPPLAFADAITHAIAHLRDTRDDADKFEVWIIVTKRIDLVEETNRWCYDVSFRRTDEKHETVTIIMLMDKTIIEPKEM